MKGDLTRRWISAILVATIFCAGCGDDDDDPPAVGDDRFASVDAVARAAFERSGVSGMGLAIYDRDGEKVFERMYGDFSADRRVALASASKLVSGVVLFRLVDEGYLSLDSTTGEVLGWTGQKGTITLRHLLSFTSGLPPEHRCIYQPNLSLAACVDLIGEADMRAPPGTRFDYGGTHLHVAGRMAEVVTGASWNAIVDAQLGDRLGWPDDVVYYANPLSREGADNPMLAGGLLLSMSEYERVLRLVFMKGVWHGTPLIDPALFDAQAVLPFPDAVVGRSPAGSARYGLTAWLMCDTPESGCSALSSPGVFGFTPWLDRAAGYYAVLALEEPAGSARRFSLPLVQELAPLIEDALRD
ncbi:MAG: beta-lactamase family protein [Gammaproteobacteria bacterium]|nr:serine hydrolase [Gammaproteobacteria bacterium]